MTSNWLLNSGAFHHIPSDLGNLSLHTPYGGPNDIIIGDGMGLFITHTGSKTPSSPYNYFKLNHVLCVHSMKKNLISISKFCHQNNTFIKFSPSSFFVKDLTKGITLLQGQVKDEVYKWPVFPSQSSLINAFSSTKSSPTIWHHRLGHLSSSIYKHVVSTFGFKLPGFSNSTSIIILISAIKVINYHFLLHLLLSQLMLAQSSPILRNIALWCDVFNTCLLLALTLLIWLAGCLSSCPNQPLSIRVLLSDCSAISVVL